MIKESLEKYNKSKVDIERDKMVRDDKIRDLESKNISLKKIIAERDQTLEEYSAAID